MPTNNHPNKKVAPPNDGANKGPTIQKKSECCAEQKKIFHSYVLRQPRDEILNCCCFLADQKHQTSYQVPNNGTNEYLKPNLLVLFWDNQCIETCSTKRDLSIISQPRQYKKSMGMSLCEELAHALQLVLSLHLLVNQMEEVQRLCWEFDTYPCLVEYP